MAKRRGNKKHQQPQPHRQPAVSTPASSTDAKSAKQSLQTISQQRAKHALENIQQYQDKSYAGKLKGYIVSFAPMILMSGFGQACAFYVSKSGDKKEEEKAYQKAQTILWDWLHQHVTAFGSQPDLMTAIVHCDAKKYQLAQVEALEYLNWLKKFAKAYLKGDDRDNATS